MRRKNRDKSEINVWHFYQAHMKPNIVHTQQSKTEHNERNFNSMCYGKRKKQQKQWACHIPHSLSHLLLVHTQHINGHTRCVLPRYLYVSTIDCVIHSLSNAVTIASYRYAVRCNAQWIFFFWCVHFPWAPCYSNVSKSIKIYIWIYIARWKVYIHNTKSRVIFFFSIWIERSMRFTKLREKNTNNTAAFIEWKIATLHRLYGKVAVRGNECCVWGWLKSRFGGGVLSAFCITRATRISGAQKISHWNASRILFPYVHGSKTATPKRTTTTTPTISQFSLYDRHITAQQHWPMTSLLPTISFFTYTMAIQPGAHLNMYIPIAQHTTTHFIL